MVGKKFLRGISYFTIGSTTVCVFCPSKISVGMEDVEKQVGFGKKEKEDYLSIFEGIRDIVSQEMSK